MPPSLLLPRQRVHRALALDPLSYVKGLLDAAPLRAPTARPSVLQPLIRRGQHAPSSHCTPHLSLCGTRLTDLPVDRTGKLAPLGLVCGSGSSSGAGAGGAVAHCRVLLGRTVKGVPRSGASARQQHLLCALATIRPLGLPLIGTNHNDNPEEQWPANRRTPHRLPSIHAAGITERQPWVHTARICLYDGARFHGAAQELRPRQVKAGARGTATWRFDGAEAALLVRCPAELLPRAQVR